MTTTTRTPRPIYALRLTDHGTCSVPADLLAVDGRRHTIRYVADGTITTTDLDYVGPAPCECRHFKFRDHHPGGCRECDCTGYTALTAW